MTAGFVLLALLCAVTLAIPFRECIVERLISYAKRKPYYHIGPTSDYYMRRWHLMPRWALRFDRNAGYLKPWRWLPFSIRLHHIMRSDAGRELHDHPWWYLTVILRGGYRELYRDRNGALMMRWRGAGSIAFHSTRFKHRLIVANREGAWTLFIHGRRSRTWGFHTVNGFVPWTDYDGAA